MSVAPNSSYTAQFPCSLQNEIQKRSPHFTLQAGVTSDTTLVTKICRYQRYSICNSKLQTISAFYLYNEYSLHSSVSNLAPPPSCTYCTPATADLEDTHNNVRYHKH